MVSRHPNLAAPLYVPETHIEHDCMFGGDLTSLGSIRVAGCIKGVVRAKSIILMSGGSIVGEIEVEEAAIAGHLEGKLSATNVSVQQTAVVSASIRYQTISVASGAKLIVCLMPGYVAPEARPPTSQGRA